MTRVTSGLFDLLPWLESLRPSGKYMPYAILALPIPEFCDLNSCVFPLELDLDFELPFDFLRLIAAAAVFIYRLVDVCILSNVED